MKNSQNKWRHRFFIITLSVTMESSGWIWQYFILIQAPVYVIITCKYEKDPIKKSREKVETSFFPNFKPMGIFSDAQGQLTLQSVVQSGRNSNSSELSCMSSLPASMKRIGCKTAEKKWRHLFFIITLIVTMETSSWIWPNFKLIQALMYVIITCKYEKDPINKSREKVETSFFPL